MSENRSFTALILCIDDNRVVLNLMENILTGANYQVVTAENGKQGLSEARSRKPDLILLDIMMPEIDGYMVCSQLQADPETAYIPVIFLTALDGAADRTKAFAVGAVDYLVKPAQKDVLLSKAAEQLQTRRHWQKLKESVISWDGSIQPVNFSLFKQSLIERLEISPEIRDRLAATTPLDIYKLCEPLGIAQGKMTEWMAVFLSLPLLSPINTDNLLLGLIPASFARENHVVAMEDKKDGRSFIISNPFDWMLLDTLKKFFGMKKGTLLKLAKPGHIEALFEQPLEQLAKMSVLTAGKTEEILAEPTGKLTLKDLEKETISSVANNILSFAISEKASDIHIEPKVDHTLIRLRIDGDLRNVYNMKNTTAILLISHLKAIAGLDITERKKPQEGTMEVVISGRHFHLQLFTTSTAAGESMIVTLLQL